MEENYCRYEEAFSNSQFEKQFAGKSCELTAEKSPLNISSFITPLPCSNKINCISEEISQDDIDQFCSFFKKKSGLSKVGIQVEKTGIAKSFAPQTCSSRFRRQIVKEQKESELEKETVESDFKTAREELKVQQIKKFGNVKAAQSAVGQKRKLGVRRGVQSKFVSPLFSNSEM